MSTCLNAAQQSVFDQIDETTFWTMACAYRNEHQRSLSEAAAFEKAVAVLRDRFPTASRETIAVVTINVLARAAPGPLDWFWD
ncbi:MAG: hypothetical protein ACR2Q4_01815 [Geminicoccaceae bacterium]